MPEMSPSLINHDVSWSLEEMAFFNSQNSLTKVIGGKHSAVSPFWILVLRRGKKSVWLTLPFFSCWQCTSIFQKAISTEAWQTVQRKGGRGGVHAIHSSVTFSVLQYLLLFRVEHQLPVEFSHFCFMHRKFINVCPLKTTWHLNIQT